MLVVLDRLAPAERVAFVLHDLFAVPFGQIAPIVDRTPAAVKKLASRARQRVRGAPAVPRAPSFARQRQRGRTAFLAAARRGDLAALLAVLAPDVIRRADPAALPPGGDPVIRGADTVARQTLVLGPRARFAEPALVNGMVGRRDRPARPAAVWPSRSACAAAGWPGYDVIADPGRLARLELAVLDGGNSGHPG